MAEGLMRHLYGTQFDVFSAGTNPTKINHLAIQILQEIGIDISKQKSKHVSRFQSIKFDYVVTLCDNNKACPFIENASRYIHKSFINEVNKSTLHPKGCSLMN